MFSIYNQSSYHEYYINIVYICIFLSLIKMFYLLFFYFNILNYIEIFEYFQINIFKYFQYFNILIFNISIFFIFSVKEDSKHCL